MSSSPFKAVIYARLSKKEKTGVNNFQKSIPDQITDCRGIIELHEWHEVAEPYKDEMSAQTVEARDDFCRLEADAKKGLFNLVVVWDYNRFGRRACDSSKNQDVFLREYGVQVYSVNQPITPDNPDNIDFHRDDRTIIQNVSNMSSEIQLSEMVKKFARGMKSKVESGQVARPRNKTYGFDTRVEVLDNQEIRYYLIPHSEQSQHVETIFKRSVYDNMGDRKIAEKLNQEGIPAMKGGQWQTNTVRHILINPIYCGKTVWNKTKVFKYKKDEQGKLKGIRKRIPQKDWIIRGITDPKFKPIVSEDLFNAAQEKRMTRRRIGKASYSKALLVGLLKCPIHQCGMIAHIRPKGHPKGLSKYSCGHKHSGKVPSCQNAEVTMSKIDEIVVQEIVKLIDDKQILTDYVKQQIENKIANIEQEMVKSKKQLAENNHKISRLIEAYEKGVINLEQLDTRKQVINQSNEKIKETIIQAENQLKNKQEFKGNQHKFKQIKDCYSGIEKNKDKLRDLLFAVIDHIDVMQTGDPRNRDYNVEIYFKIDEEI